MIELKDGSKTTDKRMDVIFEKDESSRDYPVTAACPSLDPINKVWLFNQKPLDQGGEGACVGAGITGALLCEPIYADWNEHNMEFARKKIYWPAQQSDRWPGGEYPGANPVYQGTSLLAGLKQAQRLGKISGYRWAFGLQDMIVGLGYYGPAVIAVNWYEGMYCPRPLRLYRTGRKIGGHCCLINRVDLNRRLFFGVNSWGDDWGIHGAFVIAFESMEKLLNEGGEVAFLSR